MSAKQKEATFWSRNLDDVLDGVDKLVHGGVEVRVSFDDDAYYRMEMWSPRTEEESRDG